MEDFRKLREELRLYNPELEKRPYLILANKMDEAAASENLARFKIEYDEEPLTMIAELGEGIIPLRDRLYDTLFGANPPPELI